MKKQPQIYLGKSFKTKMKERAEPVKLLSKSQSQSGKHFFFQGGCHSQAQRGAAGPTGAAETDTAGEHMKAQTLDTLSMLIDPGHAHNSCTNTIMQIFELTIFC